MKARYVLLTSLFFLVSCNAKPSINDFSIKIDNINITYEGESITTVKKATNLNTLQDLSDFMDYVVFTSKNDEVVYTSITDSFKEKLKEDISYYFRWAGQYGILAHNFIKGYDISKIDENLIGVYGSITQYAFKSYTLNENNIKVLDYTYYYNVLQDDRKNDYTYLDLPLYKNNNGFVNVSNSEELFYALANSYYPIPLNGSTAEKLFDKMIATAYRLVPSLDISEYEKFNNIFNFIINENTYDYDSFNYKDSKHTDYECYFLDGILNNKNAVCDGIVKALVSFLNLFNIEAYHIGAVYNNAGHAYAYIKINDNYYLSCPTSSSSVYKLNNKKYLYHTYSYMLTNYYTSSKTWHYESLCQSQIIDSLKNVTPYDYYSKTKIKIDNQEISLNVKNVEETLLILNKVNKVAKDNNYVMQIELLGDYDIINSAFEKFKDKDSTIKINNGMFNNQKLYTFIFNGGSL